ncbi:MAG: hypothetical protein MZV70_72985 [Desulfobacterales bacterium]|nr:hypothetical protein [Desulfobacterales bacterium]
MSGSWTWNTGIKEIFNMVPFDNRKAFIAALNKGGKGSMGLYVKGIPRFYLLQLSQDPEIDKYLPVRHPSAAPKDHDVTILHECIIDPILGIGTNMENKRIMFTSRADEALDMVDQGTGGHRLPPQPSLHGGCHGDSRGQA